MRGELLGAGQILQHMCTSRLRNRAICWSRSAKDCEINPASAIRAKHAA
jgi:hypothetical protein